MPTLRLVALLPALLALWLSHAWGAGVPATDPALVAETTQFRETGRYDEVEQRCRDWPRRHPEWVRCETVGRTAEGRTIRALVISKGAGLSLPALGPGQWIAVWVRRTVSAGAAATPVGSPRTFTWRVEGDTAA